MIDLVVASTKDHLFDSWYLRYQVFVLEQHATMEEEFDFTEKGKEIINIYKNKEIIATGRIAFLEENCKLERICVKLEERGSGIGKKLIHAMIGIGKNKGYNRFLLAAQEYAIPFYEKFGFVAIKDRFYDARIPHYWMEKTNP